LKEVLVCKGKSITEQQHLISLFSFGEKKNPVYYSGNKHDLASSKVNKIF